MTRLLVQVDTRHAASREMIAGVMRFAATHGDFEVQFSGAHPSSAPVEYFRSWKPDALIADARDIKGSGMTGGVKLVGLS